MSRRRPTQIEQRMLTVACTFCGEKAGVWCSMTGNRWAAFLHSARFYHTDEAAMRHMPAGTDQPRGTPPGLPRAPAHCDDLRAAVREALERSHRHGEWQTRQAVLAALFGGVA